MTDLKPLGPPASPPAASGPPQRHRGWYSRGYLPHFDDACVIQHIVFGLADALPRGAKPPSAIHGDRLLDAGHGSCLLRKPACANVVQDVLLHADGERYRLLAWCVMPNHVHAIAQQMENWPLADVVQAWKSTSAHLINKPLGRRGRLWRREYSDRFMRDNDHLATSVAYVEENPVRAQLVKRATDWQWSSAFERRTAPASEDAGGPRGGA